MLRQKGDNRMIAPHHGWKRLPTFAVDTHSDGWIVATEGHFKGFGIEVWMPEGFKTDFASIPRVARSLISVNGKHRLPALIHDRLYSIGYARKKADEVFRRAMLQANVKPIKAWTMYCIVRTFGAAAWRAR